MTPCCAKCKTPYGHSAMAGRCCHPIDTFVATRGAPFPKQHIDADTEPATPGPVPSSAVFSHRPAPPAPTEPGKRRAAL